MRKPLLALGLLAAIATFPTPTRTEPEKATLPRAPLDTGQLGGVPHPSPQTLLEMHRSSYILHAREGQLTRMPVEKSRLPHDPKAHPQAVQSFLGPAGTVYVALASIICKSTDGGRTWTASPKHSTIMHSGLGILSDGTLIAFNGSGKADEPVKVSVSSDQGLNWSQHSKIRPPAGHWGGVVWVLPLPQDLLVAGVGAVNHVFKEVDGQLELISGGGRLRTLLSTDGGKSWRHPVTLHDWGSEGGAVRTASGKLLAVVRYQRPQLPGDPPDLEKRTGSTSAGWPYKHVFLADSHDQGRNWTNFRQLTTAFGQTRGYPAALGDGTVVVVHDTRYGPGPPGSRAMISFDEGSTWEDEVFYLDSTTFTGSYNTSVVLPEDVILTIVGTSQAGNSWKAVTGNSEFTAIRWMPRRPATAGKAP